jgi:hypothetical protein
VPCARTRTCCCACSPPAARSAAATGRLRLTLGGTGKGRTQEANLTGQAHLLLCREQAASVERRAALLGELAVEGGAWHSCKESGNKDRLIERVLAPALQRAATAGRLAGLRAVEAPGFGLEGGMLRALALCTALTRLSLGDTTGNGCYAYAGDSVGSLSAVGSQLAALRGLRELGFAFGCGLAAAPALAGLSAMTRLTRLRLALAGGGVELSRKWSGLHKLPASLLDLSLSVSSEVCRGAGPGRRAADVCPQAATLSLGVTGLWGVSGHGCCMCSRPHHLAGSGASGRSPPAAPTPTARLGYKAHNTTPHAHPRPRPRPRRAAEPGRRR